MSKDHNHKYSILHENYDIELSNTNDLNYNLNNNNNNNNNNINLNNDLIEFCNNIGLTNDFIKALDDVGISNLNDIESMRASDITKNNGYRYLLQKLEEKTKPLHFIKFLDALDIDISNIKSSSSSSSSLMNISTQRHQIGLMSSLPLPLPSSSSLRGYDDLKSIFDDASSLKVSPNNIMTEIFHMPGISLLEINNMDDVIESIYQFVSEQKRRYDSTKIYEYDCFISYRVFSDKSLAEILYLRLKNEKKMNPFWDKKCLKKGESWKSGFLNGLRNSFTFISLLSVTGMGPCRDNFIDHTYDNVLIELQTALSINRLIKATEGRSYFLPCFIDFEETDFDADLYDSDVVSKIKYNVKTTKQTCMLTCIALFCLNFWFILPLSLSEEKLSSHLPTWKSMKSLNSSISRENFDDPGQDDTYYRTQKQVSAHHKLIIEEIIWTLLFLILIVSVFCSCCCYYTTIFDRQIKEFLLAKTKNIIHT